jgi:TBC1 domain family member 8/9
MATISAQLRDFKEPTKDELTELFFSVPSQHPPRHGEENAPEDVQGKMEISAVLSLGVAGEEDSYVSTIRMHLKQPNLLTNVTPKAGKLYIISTYLAFASLDRKSVRFTIPLSAIRRVERLNARAGVYALSLTVLHNLKIVRFSVANRKDLL